MTGYGIDIDIGIDRQAMAMTCYSIAITACTVADPDFCNWGRGLFIC